MNRGSSGFPGWMAGRERNRDCRGNLDFSSRATKRGADAERRMKAQALDLLLQPELLAFKAQIERYLPGTDDPPNTPDCEQALAGLHAIIEETAP